MRSLIALILLSLLTIFSFGQNSEPVNPGKAKTYTDQYILDRMDSAWIYLDYGNNIESALGIANELLSIEEEHNVFLAEVNAYQIIGEYHYWSAELDSAKYYYQIANDIARAEDDSSEIAYTLLAMGSLNSEQSNYDLANEYFQQAIDIRLALRDTNDILFILNRRAWMNNDADKHDLAMFDFLECLRVAEAASDTAYISASLNGIAVVHKKQENYDMAIEYFTQSVNVARASNDMYGLNAAIGNRAMVYKSMGDFEKAFEPFPDIYAFYDSVGYGLGKMSAVSNMTVIMNRMGNYDRVMEYGKEALSLAEEYGQTQTQADILNELAIAYLALGDAETAADYSERSKVLADQTYYVEKQKDARKALANIYDSLGNYKLALINHREFKALHDSMFQAEKSNGILQLQTLYETEKKEREIEKLEAEAEIDALNRNYLIAGIILLVILFSIILNREMQRRKKAKQLSEAEQERLEDKIEFQNRELTSQALNLARKNEMLQEIKNDLEAYRAKAEEGSPSMRGLFQKINFDKQIDKNWEQFTQTFTKTNASFIQNLTSSYPDLTKNDLRLAALLRMNLSSKDIATILNISDDGVKKARYRLRKKLNLETSDSLDALVMAMN